ncbi:MAG: BLUF domain-containing protein [Betaproteobacteria bacterium]|nr:BLUF domain-containing protein [Betaproteobacteria bacterium]
MHEQSRKKNPPLTITGLLVYHEQEFMQLLEGDKNVSLALYDTIVGDKRHSQVHLLWDGLVATRSFHDWSMAFVDRDKVSGCSRLLQEGQSALHTTIGGSTGRTFLLNQRDEFLRGDRR